MPRGRPRLKDADRRSEPVSVRLTKSIREQLEKVRRSPDGDRTLSQEIEVRLRRSFELDQEIMKRFGSPGIYAFLRVVAEGIADIEQTFSYYETGLSTSGDKRRWLDDRFTFDQVASMINTLLSAFRPSGRSVKPKRRLQNQTDEAKYDEFLDSFGRTKAMILLTGLKRIHEEPELTRYFLGDTAEVLNLAALPLARRIRKGAVDSYGS